MTQRMSKCSTHCVLVHGDPGSHPCSASGWAHDVDPVPGSPDLCAASPRARSSPRSLRCRAGRLQGEGTPGLLDTGRAFSTEKLKSQNQTKSQACTLPLGPGSASGAVPSRGRHQQTGSPTHTGGALFLACSPSSCVRLAGGQLGLCQVGQRCLGTHLTHSPGAGWGGSPRMPGPPASLPGAQAAPAPTLGALAGGAQGTPSPVPASASGRQVSPLWGWTWGCLHGVFGPEPGILREPRGSNRPLR